MEINREKIFKDQDRRFGIIDLIYLFFSIRKCNNFIRKEIINSDD